MPNKVVGPTEIYRRRSRNVMLSASAELKSRRTVAEERLWAGIRGNKLGARFRQQQVVGSFIVDFYCHGSGIVIEVDGGVHDDRIQIRKDRARDMALGGLGFVVLRFRNERVMSDLKSVLAEILAEIRRHTGG